jgi:hypothetical protein
VSLFGTYGPSPNDIRQGYVGDCYFLAALAENAGTPAALRLCCIDALQQIGGNGAWIVLSRIAEESDVSPVLRNRALRALRRADELPST